MPRVEHEFDAYRHVVAPECVGEVTYGLGGFLVKEGECFAHRESVEVELFGIHGNWDLRL